MTMGSRDFDGVNDVLGPSTWTFPGYPFTMGAWCQWPDTTTGKKTLVSYKNATLPYRHYLEFEYGKVGENWEYSWRAGSYRSAFNKGTAAWSSAFVLTNWAHVVGVWNAANDRDLYVNGVLRDTDNTNVPVTAPAKLYVGASPTAYFWHTNLGHVFVADVAYNANEIAALYAGASPAKQREQHVQGYWTLHGASSPEPNHYGPLGSMAVSGTTVEGTGPPVSSPAWY